jgi:hypothetical protein
MIAFVFLLTSPQAFLTLGTILLHFYNAELSAYEPFIEPWGIQLKLTQSETKIGVHLVRRKCFPTFFKVSSVFFVLRHFFGSRTWEGSGKDGTKK